jgi:hypothetical protein
MDKYTLLVLLNLPFIFFGLLRAIVMYKEEKLSRIGVFIRAFFWISILCGLVFAEDIYEYLNANNLTDSTPLSLADVVLTTGVIFCLFLCVRIYSKLDQAEKQLTELHEKISIEISKK